MIFDLVVSVLAGVVAWLATLFGSLTLPSWWLDVRGQIQQLSDQAAGFGAFVPMGTVVAAAGFVVACLAAAMVIKLVRIVASFITAGGGSAA